MNTITNYVLNAISQQSPAIIAEGRSDGKWVMIRCVTRGGCLLRTELAGTPWLLDRETVVLRLQIGELIFGSQGGNATTIVEVWESTLSLFSNAATP